MLGLYALGSVIYFYQFPEKYWPGKFDLIFSSHQVNKPSTLIPQPHLLVAPGA
jgi:hypothetical protein